MITFYTLVNGELRLVEGATLPCSAEINALDHHKACGHAKANGYSAYKLGRGNDNDKFFYQAAADAYDAVEAENRRLLNDPS